MPRPRQNVSCTNCGKNLIPSNTWQGWTPEERAEAARQGSTRAGGKGLCHRCYTASARGHLTRGEKVSRQIIAQPELVDGKVLYDIFSTIPDAFIFVGGTAEEVVEFLAEDAAIKARSEAEAIMQKIKLGQHVYPDEITHAEAVAMNDTNARDPYASYAAKINQEQS